MIRKHSIQYILLALLAGNLAFTSCSDSMVEEKLFRRLPFRYRRRSFIDQWYLRICTVFQLLRGK